ncbi:MAG: hypothetical protein V2A73_08210 [Pseudomonadota bacterium]
MRKRVLPAAIVFVVTVCALLPSALSLPQFMDENFYVWSGAYFGGKIARLDFSPRNGAIPDDPGWNPGDWWSMSAPMPFRLVYAGTMAITGSLPPAKPYEYKGPAATIEGQPDALIPDRTLFVVRLTALLCSALGIAALAFRFGWSGLLGLFMLLMPDGTRNLTLAMAEPVLVLALGLCVLAYGSRWFPLAAAFAGGSKLIGFLMWPLLLRRRANGQFGWLGLPLAILFWTIGNPASWFAGGPLYILPMLARRQVEHAGVSEASFYVASWYWVPVQYGLVFAITYLLPRIRFWHRLTHRFSTNITHPAIKT